MFEYDLFFLFCFLGIVILADADISLYFVVCICINGTCMFSTAFADLYTLLTPYFDFDARIMM